MWEKLLGRDEDIHPPNAPEGSLEERTGVGKPHALGPWPS